MTFDAMDSEEGNQPIEESAVWTMTTRDDDEWLNQLVGLGGPGAGLRSVDTSMAEIDSIFDSVFAPNAEEIGQDANAPSLSNSVQIYGSNGDILDAYYVFIHPYYPILPPSERVPVYKRPLSKRPDFEPLSPLSLAISAVLVLIPHPDELDPLREEHVKLRRDVAHSFARAALQIAEVDSKLLTSSKNPPDTRPGNVPGLNQEPFHPKVPVSFEGILALNLLSAYEYVQRGNVDEMRARADEAFTAAINLSLHETVEEDEFAEARRRTWWMTYMTVCQASIIGNTKMDFNAFDPHFVTPYPEGWKLLVEAQQTLVEAVAFVRDLDQITKPGHDGSWIRERMSNLDIQIASQLLLCRECPSVSQMACLVDSPEGMASKTMRSIAEIRLHTARIKVHRLCAFQGIPLFQQQLCKFESTAATPLGGGNQGDLQSKSAISTPPSDSSAYFPFSSQESSRICFHGALNVVTLWDNLPYPNPNNEIPLANPPYLSSISRVEIPRCILTFACCGMQSGYVMLMLCFKAHTILRNSMEASNFPHTTSLTGLLNELHQGLRLLVKCLANCSSAFEALQGMKDHIAQGLAQELQR